MSGSATVYEVRLERGPSVGLVARHARAGWLGRARALHERARRRRPHPPRRPADDARETLHVVNAASEDAARARFAEDNWAANGMLRVKSIEPWTILLDRRAA